MASGNFGGLALSASVMRSLDDMGFEEPTPVQVQAIPPLLKGRDLVAQALTGTGKTAAFGIPLVKRVDVKRNVPQAVVLDPRASSRCRSPSNSASSAATAGYASCRSMVASRLTGSFEPSVTVYKSSLLHRGGS